MKKFLLIVALAALAIGASAEGYKFEKVWEINNISSILPTNDCRQGIGIDGKYYVNCKTLVVDTIDGVPIVTTAPVVYELDENGLTGVTFEGGTNCGTTCDEAGNLIISNAMFPSVWKPDATLKVINPKTGETKDYLIPEECAVLGRCDMLGCAKGNLLESGEIFIAGGTQGNQISRIVIEDGEINYDECYYMLCDGVTASTSTVLNYYVDVNGEEAVLYVTRNAPMMKMLFDGDNFAGTKFTCPNKGACNGMYPFVWDGKEFFVYPTLPNYQDGFAIAEANADAPIVEIPSTVSANANGFQANWVTAEVDDNGVTIYQYYPGGHLTVWRLSKEVEVPNVYILGEVNDQSWAANAGTLMEYDAENEVYTATVTLDGRGASGENYFSFTTGLAEDNDEGGWAYIEPFRFGAVSDGDFWYDDDLFNGRPLELTFDDYQAFRVMAGTYTLTLSLNDLTLVIEKEGYVRRGDVDKSGDVSIADVTALIDMLLNGDEMIPEADCNQDNEMGIGDVTVLIDFLLNGVW